jgi:hypothetical protein
MAFMSGSASFSLPEDIFPYSVSDGSTLLCVSSRGETRGVFSDGTVAIGV